MRDSRLDWEHLETVRRQRERAAELETYAQTLTGRDRIRAALVDWWVELGSTASASPDEVWRTREAARLGTKLTTIAPESLAPIVEALPRVLSGSHRDDLALRWAARELAASVGEATAQVAASVDEVYVAMDFAHRCAGDWQPFRDGFFTHCAEHKDRHDVWTAIFGRVNGDVRAYLARGSEGIAEALREDDATYGPGSPTPFRTRPTGGELRLNDHAYVQFDFLLALDLGTCLESIDQMPSVAIARELVSCSELVEDRELLLRALREAKPAYTDGRPTASRALLVCVEMITQHASRLERAVAYAARTDVHTSPPAELELRSLHQIELPAWARLAFETLLDRPSDGQRVAIEYGAALSQRVDSASVQQPWSPWRVAADALCGGLQERGVRLDGVREAMRILARPSETPFFLLGVWIELRPSDADPEWAMRNSDVRASAWSWYEDLLLAKDEQLLAQVNPYSPAILPLATVGAVLAGFENPVQMWECAWARQFADRETARFRFTSRSLDPSYHLVRVGIGMLDVLHEAVQTDPDLAAHCQRLWRTLFSSLEYLLAGQEGRLLMVGPLELGRLFSYLPGVFGELWKAELVALVPFLEMDEVLAIRAASHLIRSGVARESIHEIFGLNQLDLRLLAPAALRVAKIAPDAESDEELESTVRHVLGDTSPAA